MPSNPWVSYQACRALPQNGFNSGGLCPRRGLSNNLQICQSYGICLCYLHLYHGKIPEFASKNYIPQGSPMHLKPPETTSRGFCWKQRDSLNKPGVQDLLAKTTGPLILDRPMIPPKLRVPKTRNFSPGRRKIGGVALEVPIFHLWGKQDSGTFCPQF